MTEATHVDGLESCGLLGGSPLEELRRKTQTPPYAVLWEALLRQWRRVVAHDRATDGYVSTGHLGWHSVTPGVAEAGAIWRITGDPDALAHVERCIGYLAEVYEGTPDDGEQFPQHLRRPVLSHGEVAIGADLCREALSPRAAATLCRVLRERVLPSRDFDAVVRGHSGGSNITCFRNINAGMAALLWGRDSGYDAWPSVVAGATETCRQYVRHGCDAQGFGYEGSGYVQDMQGAVVVFAELLKLHGTADLFAEEPVLRQFGHASLALFFPDRSALVNLGDVGLAAAPDMAWLLVLARRYDDAVLRGFWRELEGPPAFRRAALPALAGDTFSPTELFDIRRLLGSFLYWDADAPHADLCAAGLPDARYSPGTEIAVFRTSWGRDAVFATFAGSGRSHCSQTHMHADCGHFTLFAHGEYLAIDTGRYNAYRDQHSVVMVDGERVDGTRDGWGSEGHAGRLLDFQSHGWLDYVRADARAFQDCLWADRHCLFVRMGGDEAYLVLADNINKDNRKHGFWWQLHAHPSATVQVTAEAWTDTILWAPDSHYIECEGYSGRTEFAVVRRDSRGRTLQSWQSGPSPVLVR